MRSAGSAGWSAPVVRSTVPPGVPRRQEIGIPETRGTVARRCRQCRCHQGRLLCAQTRSTSATRAGTGVVDAGRAQSRRGSSGRHAAAIAPPDRAVEGEPASRRWIVEQLARNDPRRRGAAPPHPSPVEHWHVAGGRRRAIAAAAERDECRPVVGPVGKGDHPLEDSRRRDPSIVTTRGMSRVVRRGVERTPHDGRNRGTSGSGSG